MPDPLGFTEPETARIIGVNASTLRRYRKMGAIGHRQLPGGGIRYTQEHIDRFMKAMEVPARLGRPLS